MPSSSTSRKLGGFAALALAASLASGCLITPRSAHTVGSIASAALWTAAIAGTIVVLSYHDDHYHHEHCGHYRRWHDDRWVYYYDDRWEYYDDVDGRWYYYAE